MPNPFRLHPFPSTPVIGEVPPWVPCNGVEAALQESEPGIVTSLMFDPVLECLLVLPPGECSEVLKLSANPESEPHDFKTIHCLDELPIKSEGTRPFHLRGCIQLALARVQPQPIP